MPSSRRKKRRRNPKESWPESWPRDERSRDAELFFKELRLAGEKVTVGRSGYWINDHLLVAWRDERWCVAMDPVFAATHEEYPWGRHRTYRTWPWVQKTLHRYLDDPEEFVEKVMKYWALGSAKYVEKTARMVDELCNTDA